MVKEGKGMRTKNEKKRKQKEKRKNDKGKKGNKINTACNLFRYFSSKIKGGQDEAHTLDFSDWFSFVYFVL